MSLKKPYFRINRPGSGGFIDDPRYANDRISLCRSYNLIINDLKKIFEYIEPCDENVNVYSHRIYELFLRASTEFEANCKGILNANSYLKTSDFNIIDYSKIEKATKLSEYSVKLDIWSSGKKIFQPFKDWKNSHTLKWYKAYNNVKHDRQNNFKDASLENLLNSIAGLLCILYSQFSYSAFFTYNQLMMYHTDDEGYSFVDDSLFSIKENVLWTDEQKYDFNWKDLSMEEKPFNKFNFQQ